MNRLLTFLPGLASGLGTLAAGAWQLPKSVGVDHHYAGEATDGVTPLRAVAHSPLRVAILHDTFAVLRCYVEATRGELTLLGTAHWEDGHNVIRIDRLMLPVQSSSASHTEVTEQALAELLVEAVRGGVDTARLLVWVHSHGELSAFFSATDEHNIQDAFPQADWVLSVVTNRAGQITARLSLYKPFRIDVEDLPISVGLPQELEEEIRREVKLKVHRGSTQ
jgi:proteasome lid subunit RPN8/RPN11